MTARRALAAWAARLRPTGLSARMPPVAVAARARLAGVAARPGTAALADRVRLVLLLARPPVLILLGLFTATGLAQAGRPEAPFPLGRALLAVAGFLLFSVVCNDLADEQIDRVNLPGRRPLAAGLVTRGIFTVIGLTAGAVALAASATLRWQAVAVTGAGLAVSAAYSLPPVRLASRGAVASLILPACYVAVPYADGVLAARPAFRPADLYLLAGLYLGFTGRILLKDFRDVRGDALFGKRTFLVRHGRRATCLASGCCWAAGTAAVLAATRQLTPLLAAAEAGCTMAALWLLGALARSRSGRRDEALIAAIAIIGRGMILLLLAHLSLTGAGWPPPAYGAVMATLCLLIAGPAASMARNGPVSRLTIPPGAPPQGADQAKTAQPQAAGQPGAAQPQAAQSRAAGQPGAADQPQAAGCPPAGSRALTRGYSAGLAAD